MQSTGPDLTESTTASREPTATEPAVPEPAETVEETSARDAATREDDVPLATVPQSDVAAGQNPADEVGGEVPAVSIAQPDTLRKTFADLGLSGDLLRAIEELGYRHPTPVQEQAIPFVLMGRDVMGVAQTGTGKTAGFTLPMLDILTGRRARARMPRSLILEPTRELALQVAENFQQYGKYLKLTHALIIGGESVSDQKDVLMRGVDVLIATPGRLLDMFERGSILLSDTAILVIDEADRMLDMGFIPDVERIVSLLPANRQTLFFSATMGPEIRRLADAFLRNPKEVTVSRSATVATTIVEGLALVAEHDKREALRRMIRNENVQNALIFCNRKVDVDILYRSLSKHRFSAGALHGDMAQTIRFSTLEKFKAGELKLLVCSDVAARGLDIGGLSHVFNFDVPIHAEDYVHRIGRTGRAGLEGHAFTIAAPDDRYAVAAIEKLISHPIPPMLVQGLDPVDWSEQDGRKRRGRKKAEPRRSEARKAPEKDRSAGAKPERERSAKNKPERGPADKDRSREPRVRRQRAKDERPGLEQAPLLEHAARELPVTVRSQEQSLGRNESRRDDGRRDEPRRERYRRDEDLGPAVVGFGDEMPAFMLLRARRSPTPKTRASENPDA